MAFWRSVNFGCRCVQYADRSENVGSRDRWIMIHLRSVAPGAPSVLHPRSSLAPAVLIFVFGAAITVDRGVCPWRWPFLMTLSHVLSRAVFLGASKQRTLFKILNIQGQNQIHWLPKHVDAGPHRFNYLENPKTLKRISFDFISLMGLNRWRFKAIECLVVTRGVQNQFK